MCKWLACMRVRSFYRWLQQASEKRKKNWEWSSKGGNEGWQTGETKLAVFLGFVQVKALYRKEINEIWLINEMPFCEEKLGQQASNTSRGSARLK